jgi:DNA-binding CsgD family transcriptional regulator
MNPIAEEILMHYGIKRRSGRYPWGSGDEPYQHSSDFLARVEMLKKNGWEETPENIKKEFGLTTTQYRAEKALATSSRRAQNVAKAKSLKEDGLSTTEIGRRMGVNESTVRSWFDGESEARMKQAEKTANFLKDQVKEKGMIDVGAGVERELGVSKEKLDQALRILKEEGYPVYNGRVEQVTNKGKHTTLKVLCPPGTEHREIYQYENINTVTDYVSHDGGESFDKFVYPKSMDSKRLKIRYAEEGGLERDGIVEIRRGVDDLSLGNSHYAQVRILVDDKKYIKGMAVYSDDMPDGVDVIFNTNKKSGTDKMDVLKNIKDDPDNPFGSLIKAGGQSYYIDKDGNRQLSLINKRAEEGDWTEWKDKLPSQFLSKQPLSMAKKQLNLATVDKMAEFDEINSLTNPTVKKHLLKSFAEDCDKAAVHLQAAALPGQKYHVIIPVNSLKDNEVYAPGYAPGTKLALVRYPHGGTFEIPIVTVNNKHADARKLIGDKSIDAIGINKNVADRLSGADFDGDAVMCIPTHDRSGKVKISSTPPLKGLEGFDPKTSYGHDSKKVDPDGTEHYYRNGKEFKVMKNTGTQMGIVSNLITDMTIQGAPTDELARAVRHSMVVIDAEKHKLDYKQSEIDNGIAALKKTYQSGGASTLISRAKSEVSVDKRQGSAKVNMKGKSWYDPDKPEGSLIYNTADDLEYTITKTNKRTGAATTVTKKRKQQSTKMAETDDAYDLISDANTPMEKAYAEYANKMKSLANQARMEMMTTGKIAYSSSAKATYQAEVDSLMAKLNTAALNAPRERKAQLLANAEVKAKKQSDPNMKAGDIKKAGQQALTKYRSAVNAKRQAIVITDREWEAIQAGAISENTLVNILKNTDVDNLRQKATPRATTTLSSAKISKIKAMSNSNYSLEQIAKALGVSTSTVSNYLKGAN